MLLALELSLFFIVVYTTFFKIRGLLKECEKLKQQKQTPLVGKNIVSTLAWALGEALIIVGVFVLSGVVFPGDEPLWGAVVTFIVAYVIRGIGGWLLAWATWSIFVKAGKKKMIKDLEEEQRGGEL